MIQLNYRDGRPVYQQLKENLRQLIVTGAMAEDEKLPSVREMAASLAINPNTIQRAYRELEAEGYVYTVAGRGSFVAKVDSGVDGRRKELLGKFEEVISELLYLGVTKEELEKIVQKIAEGRQDS